MARGRRDGRLDLGGHGDRGSRRSRTSLVESFRAMLAGEVIRTVIRFD